MNVDMEFTDEEIREELARLGYENVPSDKLAEFKRDLMKLISTERSRNTSFNSSGTEQREEEGSREASPIIREISDSPVTDFPRPKSQNDSFSTYRENWHYKGKNSSRAQSARGKPRIPPSPDLYEGPLPSAYRDEEEDDNNCGLFTAREEEVEETEDAASSSESECSSKKRKTFRKPPPAKKLDLSLEQSDTAGIFEIYERIKTMAMRECECKKHGKLSSEPPYRIKGVFKTPSVILQRSQKPHIRNLVRCKPGDRLKMYEKLWKKQPAIGEDFRDGLRREMHAKLLKKEEVVHDRKTYIPNNYVVPTYKQRLNLRWRVRAALENYMVPPPGVFHD